MATVRRADGFTGRIARVEFVDGEAVTDNPGCLAFFRRKPGFEVETEAAKPAAKKRSSRRAANDKVDVP